MVSKKGMLQFRKDFTLISVQRGSKPIEGRERREQAQAIGSKISLRLSSWQQQSETTQRSKVLSDIKKI